MTFRIAVGCRTLIRMAALASGLATVGCFDETYESWTKKQPAFQVVKGEHFYANYGLKTGYSKLTYADGHVEWTYTDRDGNKNWMWLDKDGDVIDETGRDDPRYQHERVLRDRIIASHNMIIKGQEEIDKNPNGYYEKHITSALVSDAKENIRKYNAEWKENYSGPVPGQTLQQRWQQPVTPSPPSPAVIVRPPLPPVGHPH